MGLELTTLRSSVARSTDSQPVAPIVKDFNTLLSTMGRSTRQRINKETVYLKKFFFNIYLFLRQSMNRGGAERAGDTESEGSRL